MKNEGDFSLLQDVMGHDKLEKCETCQKHSPSTNSLEILRQITISIGSQEDSPKTIYIKDIGEHLLPQLGNASGEYVLQDRLINNFPYWQHKEYAFVIWYSNHSHWMISHSKDIGTSNWIFAGSDARKKWPNEMNFKGNFSNEIHLSN